MNTDFRRWAQILITVGLWCASAPAPACQICLPIPKKSVADHLIEADAVVFARENPEKPFSLISTEVLKGETEDEAIDLFLDSQSRRTLASYPERKLVCVYRDQDPDPGWQRLGMTDDAGVYEPVVRQVLERAARWQDHPRERFEYFSKFLGHNDGQLRQLAHLEVAGAPYDDIRTLGGALPPEQIRVFLDNFRYVEWHALYILLLAQSEAEEDIERIREAMRSAEKFSITNQLAAWSTAFIEVDKDGALEFLEQRYLRNADRKSEELASVIAALSVHGTNSQTQLRDRIVEGYRSLLATHPSVAPLILGDLTKWQRWDLADTIGQIVSSEAANFDLQTTLQLRAYVQKATTQKALPNRPGGNESAKRDAPSLFVWILAGACLIALSMWRGTRRGSATR